MTGTGGTSDGDTQDLTRTVVRGAGFATAGYVLTQVVSLGQFLVLTRLAAPQQFGELAAGSIVAGVGVILSESGMLAALVQRRDRIEEAAATAVVASFAGGVLFSLLALAAAPGVGAFFHSSTIERVAAVMSGYVLLNQLAVVPNALLQRRFSFLRRVALEPIAAVIGAGAAIAGTAVGFGVWGLVLGVYAAAATQAVLAWAFVRWRPDWKLASYEMWRELARFGRHVLVATGIHRANLEGRIAIVGHGLGAATLGQYSLALRIGLQPFGVIVAGVSYVIMPALARIADDTGRFRAATLRSLRSVSIAAVPLSLLLIPLGKPATVLLFGPRWGPCGTALAWMSGLGVVGALDTVASEASKAAGQPQWLPRMHVLRTAAVLGLTGALLGWGLNGAAFALSAAEILTASIGALAIARITQTSVRIVGAQLVPAAVGGAALLAALVPLRLALDPSGYSHLVGLPLLLGEAVVGLAVYALVLACLQPEETARGLAVLRRALAVRARSAPAHEGPGTPAPLP